ncbi:hypothetical protein LSH36_209g05055 [Paralvinella palmiformis]|uniref:Uncharacterized protein n=1 Tax=Paralvinella palmiformis TaxID=53620 RepID=A0AAD9N5W8_9ANNE|nr:hypothetical protein LSH36_209g05055 [Paralvinella palmiformis]
MNFAKVCGERGGIDSKITEDWKVKLPDISSGYDDKNIFNLDKSGLFFLPPHDNLLSIKAIDTDNVDFLTIDTDIVDVPPVDTDNAHFPAIDTVHVNLPAIDNVHVNFPVIDTENDDFPAIN